MAEADYVLPEVVASSEDREAWLEARRTGVTATDLAKAGKGTAAAIAQVLRDKRGELRTFDTEAFAHGRRREPVIAAWVQARFGIAPSTELYRSRDDSRFLATPDGVSESFGFTGEIAEIKTTSKDMDGPTAAYLRQVQWQMHVMGADRCLFVWEKHVDGVPVDLEPRFVWVKRDQQMIDELVVQARKIIAYMDDKEPPASPALDAVITSYLAAKADHTEAARRVKALEQQIRTFVGDRQSFVAFGTRGSVSFTTSTRRAFDQAAFKEHNPELAEQFMKESETARLTVSALKGDGEDDE